MDFKKWSNIIRVILLKIVEELEGRAKEKSNSESGSLFTNSLYSSLKFIVLEQVDSLVDEAVTFTKKQINDLALLVAQKVAMILASLVYVLVLLAIALLAFIFMAVSVAMYLGELLGAGYWGFLIVGVAIIILFVFIYLTGRNQLMVKIKKSLLEFI